MKINRAKKVHKRLQFFATNFGFRQPYQILVDGTLCFAALKGKINLQEQIPKYFGAEVKLLTTQCVIIETENLGPALFGAMLIVKQFPVHKCGHDGKPISGSSCLLSMVRKRNENRYIVATQDTELQDKIRNIPGVPLFSLHNRTPTLEAPSNASKNASSKLNEEKFSADKQPGESVSEIKKRIFGEEVPEERKHRKKKRGGPNPLSCKKRTKKTGSVAKQTPDKKPKRNRKRVKIAQHVKEHLQASVTSTVSPAQ